MKLFLFCYFIILSLVDSKIYNVRDYGAIGDGVTDDTEAIRATLAAAQAISKGGNVIFDRGYKFLTGCFNVTDNIILEVQGTILGSVDPSKYEIIQGLPWYAEFFD